MVNQGGLDSGPGMPHASRNRVSGGCPLRFFVWQVIDFSLNQTVLNLTGLSITIVYSDLQQVGSAIALNRHPDQGDQDKTIQVGG